MKLVISIMMKLAMSRESDKTEIDPVLRSRACWSVPVLVGLAMFWRYHRARSLQRLDHQLSVHFLDGCMCHFY